jgi:hypothetical protein
MMNQVGLTSQAPRRKKWLAISKVTVGLRASDKSGLGQVELDPPTLPKLQTLAPDFTPMKSRLLALPLLVAVLALLSGCVSVQKGSVMPGADLSTVKSVYVVRLASDGRNVNRMIADALVARGLSATTGDSLKAPDGVDAVITYQDKWMWDITMYMIQLDIQFRKPVSEIPIATGSSMRTSLARKSAEEMVKEVLDQIFAKGSPKSASSR